MSAVSLEQKDGRYHLKGGTPPQAFASLVMGGVVILFVAAAVLGALTGEAAPGGSEMPAHVLLMVAFFGIALLQIVARSLRAILSKTVVDPSAGTITFGRRQASRSAGRTSVEFSAIRYVALTYQAGDRHGRPGRRHFVLRLMTEQGEEDLFAVTDEDSARRVAAQLASITGRELRDLW